MINELFTIEETNLMCIYGTSNRKTLIAELAAAMPELDEPELAETATNAIAKLAAMSDADFAALELCPAYDDYDYYDDHDYDEEQEV